MSTPYDRHMEIMEAWVRRICGEVAQNLADGIVERVAEIFLEAKNSNWESHKYTRDKLEALEAALQRLEAEKP